MLLTESTSHVVKEKLVSSIVSWYDTLALKHTESMTWNLCDDGSKLAKLKRDTFVLGVTSQLRSRVTSSKLTSVNATLLAGIETYSITKMS